MLSLTSPRHTPTLPTPADRNAPILLKKLETEVPRKSRFRAHSVFYTGSCHSKA